MLPANFNQLYYFWAIAKAGSISSAAKGLLLDQSTLSVQMKQLETALGRPLLTRSRRGVALTEDGRSAFEYCERIFVHAEELLASFKKGRPGARAVFRLGISQTTPWQKALQVVDYLKSFGKSISVRIQNRSSEELQERLERHMLDLVVSDLDLSVRMGRNFRGRLVSSAQLHFAASPDLKRLMKSFPAGLARIPLLLLSPNNPIRKDVEHYLHRNGITPNIQAEIENPDIIRILAARGEGAALFDLATVGADLKMGRLVRLHRDPVGIRENIWFICSRQEKAQPELQMVMDALFERFSFDSTEMRR